MALKHPPVLAHGNGAWRPAFLAMLRNSANVRLSCTEAGITRRLAYFHREADPVFAREWDDALDDACDLLEAYGRQLAFEGSERMIEMLLKAHRPEKYRERVSQDITVTINEQAARMADQLGIPLADVLARAERIAARSGR